MVFRGDVTKSILVMNSSVHRVPLQLSNGSRGLQDDASQNLNAKSFFHSNPVKCLENVGLKGRKKLKKKSLYLAGIFQTLEMC